MKAILKSYRPNVVAQILERKKTVDIFKTKPNIKTPFDVYVYYSLVYNKDNGIGNKVIGKYTVEEITTHEIMSNGCVVNYWFRGLEKSLLNIDGVIKYANGKKYIYAWHITNLVIFDMPKELSEFNKCDGFIDCFKCKKYQLSNNKGVNCNFRKLTKAPSQWRYVAVEE